MQPHPFSFLYTANTVIWLVLLCCARSRDCKPAFGIFFAQNLPRYSSKWPLVATWGGIIMHYICLFPILSGRWSEGGMAVNQVDLTWKWLVSVTFWSLGEMSVNWRAVNGGLSVHVCAFMWINVNSKGTNILSRCPSPRIRCNLLARCLWWKPWLCNFIINMRTRSLTSALYFVFFQRQQYTQKSGEAVQHLAREGCLWQRIHRWARLHSK